MADYISKEDLINPEDMSPMEENTYQDAMRFMPLADVDRTLVAKPGDTITVPTWTGKLVAQPVGEGEEIPLGKLGQGKTKTTVQKFGVGTEYSDEADLVSLASNIEKGTREVGIALAQYSDSALLNAALALKDKTGEDGTTKPYFLETDATINGLWDILDHFEDQKDGGAYTLIGNSKDKTKFRRAVIEYLKGSDVAANIAISGATTLLDGASFAATNKLPEGTLVVAYSSAEDIAAAKELKAAQTEGTVVDDKMLDQLNTGRPFKWYVKRDVLIETDRDKRKQLNYIYGTQIAAPYVQNASKLLVVNLKKA
jgi:hypothetical protein